ncbi:MAG: glycogen/starch/alpha-glucan family phosphorylase [Clostridia bacterium]|nr:glycogen/starch/alpha-glucan family phosphorylase [Clostridia bacterium]
MKKHYHFDPTLIWFDTRRFLQARYQVDAEHAQDFQLHDALAQAINMSIAPRWTEDEAELRTRRRACYISAEWLMGRLWHNNLVCLDLYDEMEKALSANGAHLSDMEDIEDAALGNGGLGRLAACYLDAAATHDIPLTGYGLYYRFGLFKQSFADGRQQESPDDWTAHGDPWSVRREYEAVTVDFAGFSVRSVPYDMPVIGLEGRVRTLRLWKAEPMQPIDMIAFNDQDYTKASEDAVRASDFTTLLYPGDSKRAGKALRLRQQYLLCSATMQDLLRQCPDRSQFAKTFAIQLNDTHPVMSIPEFIRLMLAEGMSFDEAAQLAFDAFAFTNHPVMPEALECWSEDLINEVAPALVPIIHELDRRLRAQGHPGLYIVDNGSVHMANLAVACTHCTNGVAELHTQILKDHVFADWHRAYPNRIQNVTNGVTPRRWLGVCNRELTDMITEALDSSDFLRRLDRLSALTINDQLIDRFMEVKREKKRQLSAYIAKHEGVTLPPEFLFDVQVKRLHEYKRQLMNAISLVDIYHRLKEDQAFRAAFQPTAVIFGAKAAAGYARAKAIIYFCNKVAEKINGDPDMKDLLRVVFVQNYNCSYAERIIPAADISQQISPAGTEASGTGNMKLMLNGAVTLGTMDGANIEIAQKAGVENEYIFGALAAEIDAIRSSYDPMTIYNSNEHLRRAVDALVDDSICPHDDALAELHSALLHGASWHRADHHFLLLDFASYQEARLRAYSDYKNAPREFAAKCLRNIAGAGNFSADRSVRQYAENIWHV